MALHHAVAGEVVDLRPLGASLADATTAALAKTEQFEAVRLVLPRGKTIPRHAVSGQITLFCLEGRVILHAGREIELGAGQWVYLERGAPHAVEAVEESALLLTIMFDR
ncbi:MAG: cupin domain-containing protein [Sphingomonas sp.]|nr:cupin domain-containing protein [Sphingomonas sp.]